ncbi:hypothetical protein N431DRAFT_494620 [Stipitochalara longipes BDJ]|nr:hypothetical protein N431DRAFT_494620 [Stipitochalara longipes BDJ]
METRKSRTSAFAALLLLARLSTAIVFERQDINLTALPDAASIVNRLQYTANCTDASVWHNNLPWDSAGLVTGAGSGSSSVNIAFLRSALPSEYQNSSDATLTDFYNDMSTGQLFNLGWLGTAVDDVEAVCLAPVDEQKYSLDRLNPTQNCTATAQFLSDLGWLAGPQSYNPSASANDSSWLDFIYYALPKDEQANITDVELDVYYDHISVSSTSSNNSNIQDFLQRAYTDCKTMMCEVQGYTGNPDIGGIGVLASYTAEAALVTLYFFAVNAEIYIYGLHPVPQKNPSRFLKAFRRASDDLLDGALFFSLSISSAGWVSLHSGRSYYEKIVFTSANVLALSALFAFIAMFPGQYLKKRGHVLFMLVGGILVESSIQFVAYLIKQSNTYPDYRCLHDNFKGRYHPVVFESLFFLLVGLSLVIGAIALWYWLGHKDEVKQWRRSHEPLKGVHLWGFRARVLIEVVAIMVVWAECIYLWKIRGIMAEVAGNSWSEGAWGFGQILALFVWAPPLLSIGTTLLLPTWMTGKVEEAGGDGEEEEQEETKVESPRTIYIPDKNVPVTTTAVDIVERGK